MPLCNQDALLHFWVIFLNWNQAEIWKKYSALELCHCLPPLFRCLPLWTTVRLHGKKLQNATKTLYVLVLDMLQTLQPFLLWCISNLTPKAQKLRSPASKSPDRTNCVFDSIHFLHCKRRIFTPWCCTLTRFLTFSTKIVRPLLKF